jgi:hypothetical protein
MSNIIKLDGRIESVIREIARLHGEIMGAARTSLDKAIEIGRLLYRVRASRKGKWLKWLEENAPFSQKTAWRYMECYNRRDELKLVNVTNLADAYALLCPPITHRKAAQLESLNVADVNGGAELVKSDGAAVVSQETTGQPQPCARRTKSHFTKMRQLPGDIAKGFEDLWLRQLSEMVAHIAAKTKAARSKFPGLLIEYGNALIKEGERLRKP